MRDVSLRMKSATHFRLGAIGAFAAFALAFPGLSRAQSANLAMIGEPQSLDPMASSADLVGTIMQHVYEPLYTFDAKWALQPMLAAAMPEVLDGGKKYTIKIREG